MKVQLRFIKLCLVIGTVLTSSIAFAQNDQEGGSVETDNNMMPGVPANPTAPSAQAKKGGGDPKKTEAGSSTPDPNAPLDSPYERKIFKEKRVLTYDDIREADVFFEKRIWRVIDVREKLNKPFMYPKEPFINIIMDAAKNKEVSLYSTVDGDEFKTALTAEEAKNIGSSVDTVVTYHPETYEAQIRLDTNVVNIDEIKQMHFKMSYLRSKN